MAFDIAYLYLARSTLQVALDALLPTPFMLA